MKKQTHKEYMDYLKEYDPITYYEMTSDPGGNPPHDYGCLLAILVICFIALMIWLFVLLLLAN